MKTIIALAVLAVSFSASANTYKGPKDTTEWTCYALIKKINFNGQLSLTTDGENKTNYVSDPAFGSYCSDGVEQIFVKTQDFKGCPLFVCDNDND